MGEHFDVVIVGAGPAGLAAAFELTEISELSVLTIDKGQSIEERRCPSIEDMCSDHANCNVTHGSGGAGLYSDGKLCLDPAVGGDISRFYTEDESHELMHRVVEMLCIDSTPITPSVPPRSDIDSCRKAFDDVGLNFRYYDVARIGLKERIERVMRLEQHLKSKGVEFLFDTNVKRILPHDGYKIVTSKGNYHCKYLVVAPGKIGANWFHEQFSMLGISSYNNPLYVGARLELPREVTSGIAELTDNPRISMGFDNGDYIKTHCFSDRGRVVIADYNGLKLVEGNYLETKESDNASVNIVMEINLPGHIVPFVHSRLFIQQINGFGNGRPVVQTVSDLFNFTETSPEALRNLALEPTLNDCRCCDLSQIYSVRFADRLSSFIKQVSLVVPGFDQGGNLIYAPFVEWWMKKVEVNKYFETARKDLHAIGDGAGMSQGIIAAGMQGIACARGIYGKSRLH